MADGDTQRQLRVSDDERAQALKNLDLLCEMGYLTPAEYEERSSRASAALTRGDIIDIFNDIPASALAQEHDHHSTTPDATTQTQFFTPTTRPAGALEAFTPTAPDSATQSYAFIAEPPYESMCSSWGEYRQKQRVGRGYRFLICFIFFFVGMALFQYPTMIWLGRIATFMPIIFFYMMKLGPDSWYPLPPLDAPLNPDNSQENIYRQIDKPNYGMQFESGYYRRDEFLTQEQHRRIRRKRGNK